MLQRDELRDLIIAFGETCRFITTLQSRAPVAKHVQYPKIPTILSESIAVIAIQQGLLLSSQGPFSAVIRGGRAADILAAVAGEARQLKIEIKASGTKDFATFGPKDYAADFLLWMRFENLLHENNFGCVEVLICPNPVEHLPWRRSRVTVAQLTANWKGDLAREYIDLSTLLEPPPSFMPQRPLNQRRP